MTFFKKITTFLTLCSFIGIFAAEEDNAPQEGPQNYVLAIPSLPAQSANRYLSRPIEPSVLLFAALPAGAETVISTVFTDCSCETHTEEITQETVTDLNSGRSSTRIRKSPASLENLARRAFHETHFGKFKTPQTYILHGDERPHDLTKAEVPAFDRYLFAHTSPSALNTFVQWAINPSHPIARRMFDFRCDFKSNFLLSPKRIIPLAIEKGNSLITQTFSQFAENEDLLHILASTLPMTEESFVTLVSSLKGNDSLITPCVKTRISGEATLLAPAILGCQNESIKCTCAQRLLTLSKAIAQGWEQGVDACLAKGALLTPAQWHICNAPICMPSNQRRMNFVKLAFQCEKKDSSIVRRRILNKLVAAQRKQILALEPGIDFSDREIGAANFMGFVGMVYNLPMIKLGFDQRGSTKGELLDRHEALAQQRNDYLKSLHEKLQQQDEKK